MSEFDAGITPSQNVAEAFTYASVVDTARQSWFIEATVDSLPTDRQVLELRQLAHRVGVVQKRGQTEIGVYTTAISVREAFNAGLDRIGILMHASGFIGSLVRAETITEETRLVLLANRRHIPDIVGVAEIQQILNVKTRQQVGQMADRDNFPRPIVELAAGRIWLREEIEDFKKVWRRKRGPQ